jgi:hypothetical protein
MPQCEACLLLILPIEVRLQIADQFAFQGLQFALNAAWFERLWKVLMTSHISQILFNGPTGLKTVKFSMFIQ